jgi:hypothetical protein
MAVKVSLEMKAPVAARHATNKAPEMLAVYVFPGFPRGREGELALRAAILGICKIDRRVAHNINPEFFECRSGFLHLFCKLGNEAQIHHICGI